MTCRRQSSSLRNRFSKESGVELGPIAEVDTALHREGLDLIKPARWVRINSGAHRRYPKEVQQLMESLAAFKILDIHVSSITELRQLNQYRFYKWHRTILGLQGGKTPHRPCPSKRSADRDAKASESASAYASDRSTVLLPRCWYSGTSTLFKVSHITGRTWDDCLWYVRNPIDRSHRSKQENNIQR